MTIYLIRNQSGFEIWPYCWMSQMYGHSRQGGCGVCQGISMGSETWPLKNGLIHHYPKIHLVFKIKPPAYTALISLDFSDKFRLAW